MNKQTFPKDDIEELRTVEEVQEYQGSFADYSVLLNEDYVQELRVYFLKHLRSDWIWRNQYTSEKHENGHVQFEAKK